MTDQIPQRKDLYRVVGVYVSGGESVTEVSDWFLCEDLAVDAAQRMGVEEWEIQHRSVPQAGGGDLDV